MAHRLMQLKAYAILGDDGVIHELWTEMDNYSKVSVRYRHRRKREVGSLTWKTE